MRSHQGYNIPTGRLMECLFWAVSDVDAAGLVKLAELLKVPAPPLWLVRLQIADQPESSRAALLLHRYQLPALRL
jgi:hypothetical protein